MKFICADELTQQIYFHGEAETSLVVKAMTDFAVLPERLKHMAVWQWTIFTISCILLTVRETFTSITYIPKLIMT